jgi:mannose-6-phosphate isomerase
LDAIVLEPNQLHRFYRGGAAIAALRGRESRDEHAPEDWVGSTVTTFGEERTGLTVLDDGRPLRDAIAHDPEAFLGPGGGAQPELLVKLLDAGERLPVHFHPEREFARRELGSPYGKSEAWAIVEASPGAAVHVGFREEVLAGDVARWVETQDAPAMLAALNEVPVQAGDTIFVPAGTAHAIGEGILLVELQEPSDLSILLEWDGFEIDGRESGHLGLGFERALEALDRRPLGAPELERLFSGRGEARPGVETLFPAEADAFFRAERLRPDPVATLDAAFSILVVVAGEGTLAAADGGALPLRRGSTVLVPHAAGECRVEGGLDAIRCLPPAA